MNSAGIFLNDDAVERVGLDLREVGRWLLDYTALDNLYELDEVPDYYAGKADVPLFDGDENMLCGPQEVMPPARSPYFEAGEANDVTRGLLCPDR